MPLTYGSSLLQKTATQSFWNSFYSIPDPFDGLIYTRPSTQKTDTYTRLGSAPMPQEWVGDKEAKDVNEYDYPVTNVAYESTFKVGKELIKFQQWDEIANVIGNQGMKARAHRTKLYSDLLNNGDSTAGDDDQNFFDTDHKDPGAEYTTNQDNDLTGDITDPDAPTDIEFRDALDAMFDALWSFKDDRGDPMVPQDENPSNYILMVPTNIRSNAKRMVKTPTLDTGSGTVGNPYKDEFTPRVNPFLTVSATNVVMYLFYAGSNHKPLILQEAGALEFDDSMTGDEYFRSGSIAYSASWWGKATYGQWRTAVRYEFT